MSERVHLKSSVDARGVSGGKLSVTATSAQTSAINYRLVHIVSDVTMFVSVGLNPTAVVDVGYKIVADLTYPLVIDSGDKIAAICNSGDSGGLWFHPVS